jgi:LysM repeat protein
MTVEPGQRVRDIAKVGGTTPRKIKDANCLSNYAINAGDMLWVPQWPPAMVDAEATSEAAESTETTETAAAPADAETTEAEGTCPVPDGWVQATVEKDMKLKDIAEIIGSKARVIKEGNCLPNYKVTPGQMIWVPPLRNPSEKDAKTTVTVDTNCPYPENWVQMTVQKDQKLRDIAHKIGVQPREIKGANCLPDTKVQTGMILWVPRGDGKG